MNELPPLREFISRDLLITTDSVGDHHFLTVPQRTVIDVHSLPFGKWIAIDELVGTISITLDGQTVVYERVGTTLSGHWACRRVR